MAETATIRRTPVDFEISELYHPAWEHSDEIVVTTYWSGEEAPAGLQFAARMLWSDTSLYVRFAAARDEPLVLAAAPDLTKKTIGLWERDVCEIFVAPDASRPNRYFEFEVAPSGEWLDLAIELDGDKRLTDWEYESGLESAAQIGSGQIQMGLKVPFASIGGPPSVGDVWHGGLFRCVGSGPERGYLAWRPTATERPNFHVPSSFGRFVFE